MQFNGIRLQQQYLKSEYPNGNLILNAQLTCFYEQQCSCVQHTQIIEIEDYTVA